MGWLLELRVLQGKQVVLAAFLFFRRPFKRSCQAACTLYNLKNPIKISRLLMCRLLFIPAAALRHYTPNVAGSGRLKRVYTSKSSLR